MPRTDFLLGQLDLLQDQIEADHQVAGVLSADRKTEALKQVDWLVKASGLRAMEVMMLLQLRDGVEGFYNPQIEHGLRYKAVMLKIDKLKAAFRKRRR